MRFSTFLLMLCSLLNMKGFLQKAKAELKSVTQRDNTVDFPGGQRYGNGVSYPQQQEHQDSDSLQHRQPRGIREPSRLDILRYRYHYGTNLGSVYVIERWLQPSRFPDGAEGSSELAAVQAWVSIIGIEATKQKFEEQWANSIPEEALEWLTNVAKVTTVRLPIGYYDLPGMEFTQGTPFEPYAYVYSEAWNSIRTLIARLRARSIGVLIDLHALPGGANAQEHSGTNSGRAEFWNSPFNRALGVRCCQFIAEDSRQGLDIAGIQLVNEAIGDAENMYQWYDEAIANISSIDPSIPVVISDAWNLDHAIDYSFKKNTIDQLSSPVVVDTHCYWAFTDGDKAKSPQQIIGEAGQRLSQLDGKEGSVHDRGAVQAIIGEYSCVMSENSWNKSGGIPKEELVKQFGHVQCMRYQQRAGGSYFWNWKMDWMPGGEWGFVAQSNAGNIVPPQLSTLSTEDKQRLLHKARHEFRDRRHEALQQHVAYWKRTDANGHYEHRNYDDGWKIGYQDALTFLEGRATQGDKIGMLELWVLKRIRESGLGGDVAWLFEQGMRKGILDFYAAIGL
ncbi:similar to glucan 1,3-beta-glucosidase [Plenodomus lingam JN3]|uniref:Similar to glucan 1,3-beta-glucosidase n=1 Tax=Leptosphaeria maculans (strain JN3 / isolate v23.1.3 / race Av1-4-5-6-7-8) TaxID=985895 RepID=E4ZK64_LEPMJ|nr:similar to glucan 1,3-beta-glucosidase [Plenodomus lingam JN3]CBX91659.1 similar to glucan 1,3-beta-glucosidase [Plenodomus lingam JN3]